MNYFPKRCPDWAKLGLVCGWLACSSLASHGAGYLPVVGPGSLRFRQPPPAPLPAEVEEVAEPVAEEEAPIDLAALAAEWNELLDGLAALPPEVFGIQSRALVTKTFPDLKPTPIEEMITPEMLVQFFRNTSSTGGVSVILPLKGVGAETPQPVSRSRAVYNN